MSNAASSPDIGRLAKGNIFGAFRISTRILGGFAVIDLMMIGMAVFSVTRVQFVDQTLSTISDVNGLKQHYAIR